jgi:hypothetical protein
VTDPLQEPVEPAPPPATRPPGNPIALGCGGFVSFFALALVVGMAAAAIGWLVLGLIAIGVGLAVQGVRRATPAGRTDLARFAVGFAIAAVLFGGCIVLISNADFR